MLYSLVRAIEQWGLGLFFSLRVQLWQFNSNWVFRFEEYGIYFFLLQRHSCTDWTSTELTVDYNWDSHRSDAGDWQAHHGCHWGHQRNRVPLPTPVYGSSTGGGMRSPSRILWSPNEMSLQPFTLFSFNISTCGFVLVDPKKITIVIKRRVLLA